MFLFDRAEKQFDRVEKPANWLPPRGFGRRFCSALIDYAVWWFIVGLVSLAADDLLRPSLRIPKPTGSDPRDPLFLALFGLGVVGANLYLTVSAAIGRSIGKALTGLRLAVTGTNPPARPGFARGLVRSAALASPFFGVAVALPGLHDQLAGTTICRVSDNAVWTDFRFVPGEVAPSPTPTRIGVWRVVIALLFHAFVILGYMIIGAL